MAATVRRSKICNIVETIEFAEIKKTVHHLIFNKEVRFGSRLFIHIQARKALNMTEPLE